MVNYNLKVFRSVSNSENGEITADTLFVYHQIGSILTSTYHGEQIQVGHLLGVVDEEGNIDMRYHQINALGQIRTGTCRSVPKMLPNGKIRLHESWEWTSGNHSKGESILDEI